MDASLQLYTNNYINYNNLKDSYNIYTDANSIIQSDIKKDKDKTSTNYRKSYYEQQAIETASSFFLVIFVIYVIVAFLTLITLFRNPSSTKVVLVISLIGFILFPFFSTSISLLLIKIWKGFMGILPKNVYHSL